MTVAQNKQLVLDVYARFSRGDIPGVLDLMTDDVTWWILGKPELTPTCGSYDKERLRRLFARMQSQLVNGLALTVLRTIGEDDSVVAEVESAGELRNGRQYRQQYLVLFTFRDGKIASAREYLDTQHAFDVWIRA
ncbi:MAG TPA: nuclear transport factor 2 family protein [Kofleriaceae bacterium]